MSQRHPAAMRDSARRLHAEGRSIAHVAKMLGVAYCAAHKWIRSADSSPAPDPVWLLAVSGAWRKEA